MNIRDLEERLPHPVRLDGPRSGGSFLRIRRVAVQALSLLLIYILFSSSLGVAVLAETVSTPTLVPTEIPLSMTLPISVEASSVLVVDLSRGVRLFEKDATLAVGLPALNRAVTALIALERYSLDTMVTVSKVAADADAGKLGLKKGEKVPLEYLLLALMLQGSDAAAIAVSEQVSGEESSFVTEMNAKAESFGMVDTVFQNATGKDVVGQSTNVEDAVRFFRRALVVPAFQRIFSLRDSLYFFPDGSSHHFTSRMDSAWSFVDSLTGGIRADSGTNVSAACTATSRNVNILCVAAVAKTSKIVADLEHIASGCFDSYESAVLVSAGQSYPTTETVAGVTFGLVYSQTVQYVRPVGIEYLKEVRYESLGKTSLPIRKTQSVGKVVFTMTDGTSIVVDVFPAEDVWNPSSLRDRLQILMVGNQDLVIIILALLALLVLIGIGHIAETLVKQARRRRT
jgi:D-alanyl-D-alanine carboxypeptidase